LRFGLLADDFFFFLAAGAVAAFFLSSFRYFRIILDSCRLSFEVRGVSEEEVEDVDEEEEEDDVDDDEDSRVGRFGLVPVFLAGGCLSGVTCWVDVETAESAVALRSRSEACRC
jgi:hypothetical protein